MPRQLPRLPPNFAQMPDQAELLQRYWQELVTALEQVPEIAASLQGAIDEAQDAADLAIAAAASADEAADAITSEQSLVNSFVTNFTPPLIQADSAGNVTIADHDRQYGNPALDPTVAVDGDTIASGEVNPAVVRVYYTDPARAGGAVSYLFTVDPADPPVQGGDIHVVGAVEIPAAGTSDGGFVRPPGYTGVQP